MVRTLRTQQPLAAAISRARIRPILCAPIGAIALLLALPCAIAAENKPNENWIATWTTANSDSSNTVIQQITRTNHDITEFDHQTIREIVRTTVGGSAVRIRLSNAFGHAPITFGAVAVGIQREGAALMPGSNHSVTFDGKSTITIPEGADALSDEIAIMALPHQNLTVSLFAAKPTGPATRHPSAFQTNYVSETGKFAAGDSAEHFKTQTSAWFFLAEVEVRAAKDSPGTIVALGDSITDGASTKPDAYQRWTDVLAERFGATHSEKETYAVVNAGFGGNRVLSSSPCFAENALARLDRDIFAVAGVRGVILFEGTNDIGQPETHAPPLWAPCLAQMHITAEELISGYAQIIAQVHAHQLKIYGATILPFQGFNGFTEKGEATRVAANAWIRNSHAFDGVIDFDAALADPANREQMAAQYDSGDHLHPNPAGHEAMARAVDLKLFTK